MLALFAQILAGGFFHFFFLLAKDFLAFCMYVVCSHELNSQIRCSVYMKLLPSNATPKYQSYRVCTLSFPLFLSLIYHIGTYYTVYFFTSFDNVNLMDFLFSPLLTMLTVGIFARYPLIMPAYTLQERLVWTLSVRGGKNWICILALWEFKWYRSTCDRTFLDVWLFYTKWRGNCRIFILKIWLSKF